MITQLTALNNTTVIPAKLQHSREGRNLEKNNPELFVKKACNQSRPGSSRKTGGYYAK